MNNQLCERRSGLPAGLVARPSRSRAQSRRSDSKSNLPHPMPMRYRLWLVSVLLLLLSGTVHAQWVQTGGPYGGDVNSFAVIGANLFAGTAENGVFLSTDNGMSWRTANSGLTSSTIDRKSTRLNSSH